MLGGPNAQRGRSTAPGNILASEAVAAGACDVLCSDYLPMSLLAGALALASAGIVPLATAVDLVTAGPARVLGLPRPAIEVGRPLDAVLVGGHVLALWRDGRAVFDRRAAAPRPVALRRRRHLVGEQHHEPGAPLPRRS
ncbi:MAG: hypothetical protein ACRD1K_08760 [Acidimicrobiales bacterium]